MTTRTQVRRLVEWSSGPIPITAILISLGLVVFLAGTILRPPLGGLIATIVLTAIGLSVALLIQRPGMFLVLFLVYATFAPFLSRLVHAPLGWLKGTFFLLILPVWILARVAVPVAGRWSSAARIPLLCYGGAVLLIGILAVISILRGVPMLQVLDGARGYLLYPPLMFVALEAAGDRDRIRRFLWLVLGLTAVVSLGAVVQSFLRVEDLLRLGLHLGTGAVVFIAIDPISGKVYQRLFSILDDQSSVAAFAFIGIALCLYLLFTRRGGKGRRAVLLSVLGLNGYSLLLTYNMTLLSGTVLYALIVVLRRRSLRLFGSFLIVVLIVGGIAWLRYGDLIRNRLATSFSIREGVSTSLVVRIEANKRALGMLIDQPVLGQGIGATANTFVYYRLGMSSSFEGGFAADNFYMTTALETGLIGLGAVLLIQLLPVFGLRRLGRSRDPSDRMLAIVLGSAVIVLLLMNLSNGPMNTNPTNLLYWSFTGLVWRISRSLPAGPESAGVTSP